MICIVQQGTVCVSRPKGKLLGIPFLTLAIPKSLLNKSHSQTSLKQDFIGFLSIKTSLPKMIFRAFLIVILYGSLKSSFHLKSLKNELIIASLMINSIWVGAYSRQYTS